METTGTFTATGQSGAFVPKLHSAPGVEAGFNVSLSGTFTATVSLQKSYDSGSTWHNVGSAYTAAAEEQKVEYETGVQYRFNCTAYTSGTVTYRLSN